MYRIAPIFAAISLLSSYSVGAIELDQQKQAIDLIQKTASALCNNIPTDGETTTVTLDGEATLELNMLFRKLVDLNISGAAEFSRGTYQGVLQEDLSAIVLASQECTRAVWTDLQAKLIPSLTTVDPQLSPSELLVKDQNPTKLTIVGADLKNYVGSDKTYLTVRVENLATVSAKNVKARFFTPKSELLDKTNVHKTFHRSDLIIRSGNSYEFPIISISELAEVLIPKTNGWKYIGQTRGTNFPSDNEARQKLCSSAPFELCPYSLSMKGIAVSLEYESIFGDKIQTLSSINVIFGKSGI
ncbi:hypothetical protein [Thalassospira tepidiphila]|uniref:Uncharacterized protein n=2 Tax=Thalassospira tepidiphila TaxID=393657 RepID=A0A853KVB5_9PROT|nr:hypothetical protein [Thalassospira tepidiphila]NJB76138.1 hypothetical protein [Thalassospira tepidiphila]OAZ08225.1 hypothetical protein TH4_17975 [Thalassospira tepidiphila MCCC 1A03514]